jgi:hypothetical protein
MCWDDPVNWIDPEGLRSSASRGTTQSIVRHYQQQIARTLEPVRQTPRQNNYSLADILPQPSDWYDLYKHIDFGENCKLICGEDNAGMSCSAQNTPYMQGCRLDCRD